MEHPHFIVALTGNPRAGKNIIFRSLTKGKLFYKNTEKNDLPLPNGSFVYAGYKYKAIEFPGILSLSSPLKEAGYTTEYICSGKVNVIVITGHALMLRNLLHLLKEILSLDLVRDRQIPVVLCLSCCDEAEQNGVFIDISLLHDVLQIPIVPLYGFSREQMDNLKAAFHYSVQPQHRAEFLYNCLDFSPAKLARECITIQRSNTYRDNENRSKTVQKTSLTGLAVLLAFVFWITSAWTGWFMERLWPVLFQAEANLAALSSWLGMHVWFTECLVHGAFQSACFVILVALPPFSLFFPLLGLLEDAGYIPWNGAGLGIAHVVEDNMRFSPGYYGYTAILAAHILILTITAINPSLMPLRWPYHLPLPQPFIILRIFCCILSGAAASLTLHLSCIGSLTDSLSVSPEIPGPRKPVRVFESIFRSTGYCTISLLNKAVLIAVLAGIMIWLLNNIEYTGPENGWLAFILSGQNSLFLYDMLISHSWTLRTILYVFLFSLLYLPCSSLCMCIYRMTNSRLKVIAAISVSTSLGIILYAAATVGIASMGI